MGKCSTLLAVAMVLGAGSGCATQTRSVTTESRDAPSNTVVETKTETTETRSESGGVLSSTVDVVGEVLSLPFRAVGALIRGIF